LYEDRKARSWRGATEWSDKYNHGAWSAELGCDWNGAKEQGMQRQAGQMLDTGPEREQAHQEKLRLGQAHQWQRWVFVGIDILVY